MKGVITALGLLVAAALVCCLLIYRNSGGCFQCATLQSHRHGSNERNPSTGLKTLASAQAYFRANDQDNDGVNQFWRSDVSGLYTVAPTGSPAIKLIELSVACADDRPKTDILKYSILAPKAGYWYRAIRHADEDLRRSIPTASPSAPSPTAPAPENTSSSSTRTTRSSAPWRTAAAASRSFPLQRS